VRAVVAAPVLVCGEVKGALYVTRRGPLSFCEADADMVSAVATLLASGIEKFELRAGLVQERHRRKQLERFHPSEVVSEIFAKNKGLGQLEEYSATALVCDLHHFDKLAGQVPPRDVARVMYEYYDMLYAKVFGAGGSLIKLHNGWALALFGMHTTGEDRTEWAVEAALRLCDEFASVSVLWPKSELMVLRCALDVGTVVAGVVGSPDRLEFAALGPAVSTASEIAESGTRTSVLLSERVFRRLPQKEYAAEDVGSVRDQRVYRVIDP